jgi:hypothetical protein
VGLLQETLLLQNDGRSYRFILESNAILDSLAASQSINKRALYRLRTIKRESTHFEKNSPVPSANPKIPKRDEQTGIILLKLSLLYFTSMRYSYQLAVVN